MPSKAVKTKINLIHFLERMTAVSGVTVLASLATALTIATCLPITIDNRCYAEVAASIGDGALKTALIFMVARRLLVRSLPHYCGR